MDTLIPKKIDDFIINKTIAQQLKIIKVNTLLNLMLYGPKNSGKKTMVDAFLSHLYQCDIQKCKSIIKKELKVNNNTIEIEYIISPYHIEINLYEYGFYDKNIVNDFIQDIIKYKSLICDYHLIVINHFDRISRDAQNSFKRMIETYANNVRFIIITDEISKIDRMLLSRFMLIRVKTPSKTDILDYISYICKNKNNKFLESMYCDNLNILNHRLFIHINTTVSSCKIDINLITPLINEIEKPDLSSIKLCRGLLYNYLLLNCSLNDIYLLLVRYYIKDKRLNIQKKNELITFSAKNEVVIHRIEYNIIPIEYLILFIKKILYESN